MCNMCFLQIDSITGQIEKSTYPKITRTTENPWTKKDGDIRSYVQQQPPRNALSEPSSPAMSATTPVVMPITKRLPPQRKKRPSAQLYAQPGFS